MGRHRSGRIEERLSFVSGRGGWHPTSAPDTNGIWFLAWYPAADAADAAT